MTDHNDGYLQVICGRCQQPRGEHADGVWANIVCPTRLRGEFVVKFGDEWCHDCDDFEVNCEHGSGEEEEDYDHDRWDYPLSHDEDCGEVEIVPRRGSLSYVEPVGYDASGHLRRELSKEPGDE